MQLPRAHEVDERLHHAVKTMYFTANDVHVAARVRVLLREFVLQKLQMQHNGVDRVLNLMSHAAGYAPAGGETAGHLNLISDTADGLSGTHDEQRAHLNIFFLNQNKGDPEAPPPPPPPFPSYPPPSPL